MRFHRRDHRVRLRSRGVLPLSGSSPAPRSQPSVEPSERAGKHERHAQDARPKDKDVPGTAQFEVPDPAHKQIACLLYTSRCV